MTKLAKNTTTNLPVDEAIIAVIGWRGAIVVEIRLTRDTENWVRCNRADLVNELRRVSLGDCHTRIELYRNELYGKKELLVSMCEQPTN